MLPKIGRWCPSNLTISQTQPPPCFCYQSQNQHQPVYILADQPDTSLFFTKTTSPFLKEICDDSSAEKFSKALYSSNGWGLEDILLCSLWEECGGDSGASGASGGQGLNLEGGREVDWVLMKWQLHGLDCSYTYACSSCLSPVRALKKVRKGPLSEIVASRPIKACMYEAYHTYVQGYNGPSCRRWQDFSQA